MKHSVQEHGLSLDVLTSSFAPAVCSAAAVAASPWSRHASQWHSVSSPLRPNAEDVGFFQDVVTQLSNEIATLRAVVLGVTPELIQLCWPRDTTLCAVDASDHMISSQWCATNGIASSPIRARWEHLPLASHRFNLVLADGSLNILPSLQAIRLVLTQIQGALAHDGRLAIRVFARPEKREQPDEVLRDMLNHRIGNFHVAKWRLAMALHGSLSEGVELNTIWKTFRAAVPHNDRLIDATGWPTGTIDTIDAYRSVSARYFFPTLSECNALFAEYFTAVSCRFPSYELGERCPTLVMKPIQSDGTKS